MVERPIKKADRQPKADDGENTSSPKRFDDSDKKRSSRDNNGGDRKGKRGSRDEEVKQPVNLALVRGPKPTKPQPEIIPEEVVSEMPETTEESETETINE